jgi:hypothetical protein
MFFIQRIATDCGLERMPTALAGHGMGEKNSNDDDRGTDGPTRVQTAGVLVARGSLH